MKTHRIAVYSNGLDGPEKMVELWWDGKKVQNDNEAYMDYINDYAPGNTKSKDGLVFLDNVPLMFKSGYTSCKRLPDEV